MSQIIKRWPIIAMFMALLFFAAGCSSSNGGSSTDPDTGKHPDNWIQKHPGEFIENFLSDPDVCEKCHGSDPVLRGGISDVSCFNVKCHGSRQDEEIDGAPVLHVLNGEKVNNLGIWTGPPPLHGKAAKAAPSKESGFAVCQACHGTKNTPFFGGGVFGPTCFLGCHGPEHSPHPNDWLPDDTYTHSTTNPGNAPVCANCHFHRKNLPEDAAADLPPFKPAPKGTPPGCFNSTLCHGALNPHPPGWAAPTVHGLVAKGAPTDSSGFQFCQECHGPFVRGGSFNCQNCHEIVAPHPKDWLPGDAFTHTTTDPGNAPVCANCHRNSNPGTPGCFNNTLCHGAVGNPHPSGWASPTVHGPVAKAAPGATSGFEYCQVCHGPFVRGGSFNCQNCHGIVAPHPSAWLPGDAFVHTNTDPGNAPVCANCHRNSNPGTPGCSTNTLCHGAVGNPHPSGWASPTVHGPVAKEAPSATGGFEYCQVCHGPFTPGGTFNCQNCHGIVAPHPSAWMPGDTYRHTSTNQGNAPVCANCHRNNNPGTPGCFNNTLCHGSVGIRSISTKH